MHHVTHILFGLTLGKVKLCQVSSLYDTCDILKWDLAPFASCPEKAHPHGVKVKPVDVNSSTSMDFGIENNKKHHKFKVGDHVKISKYKNIFAKSIIEIGQKKCL